MDFKITYKLDLESLDNERKTFDLSTVSKKQIVFDLNKATITLQQDDKKVSIYSSVFLFISGVFGGINFLIKPTNKNVQKTFVSDYGNSFNFNISLKNNIIRLDSTFDENGNSTGASFVYFEEYQERLLVLLKRTALSVINDIVKICPEYNNNEDFMKMKRFYEEYSL